MNVVTPKTRRINGIDVDWLMETVDAVAADPAKGKVAFRVKSAWQGQTKSRHSVESFELGGETVKRRFDIPCDEPVELGGENTAANPQELLLSALNACMMVGYVAGCAVRGITLESLELETDGALDLRGFLGIDPKVKPGYDAVRVKVTIKGNGTAAQYREVHETVLATSPNYFNVTQPIKVDATLAIV
ncbi:MAG: OsmC family protein [Rhodospirillaceae bacterium]|nr:OsmC family protein [Rhodospirillaceae bacterium]